jgi:cellulose synthase/poly-beta-1,6-N-acetylglucosamine synthase-like glycosyltransferase
MCFSADMLDRMIWREDSLTEDLDFGLDLLERYGIRVHFIPDAIVYAQMPATAKDSVSQRRR